MLEKRQHEHSCGCVAQSQYLKLAAEGALCCEVIPEVASDFSAFDGAVPAVCHLNSSANAATDLENQTGSLVFHLIAQQ
jgi:hypothetical protein